MALVVSISSAFPILTKMADRAQEWIQRKQNHAHDPLVKLQEGSQICTAQTVAEPLIYIAAFEGKEIARTRRAQIVNCRVYFPFEDISHQYLISSSKRWR